MAVDDDPDMLEVFQHMLRSDHYDVEVENSLEPALRRAAVEPFDAVLADLKLGSESGLTLCRELAAHRPDVPVVIATGCASMDAVIDALRAGAFDFITKPPDPAQLRFAVGRATRHRQLLGELSELREKQAKPSVEGIVGDSLPMRRTIELMCRVAPSNASVLITGESGSGKELVARGIHARSNRRDGPFVAINCGAMVATLLESELFGHVRGAFTDARRDRAGLLLEASGGTLFLDEIGEMPLDMQTKLLRVLQERTVRPVGGQKEIPFDTRVVAASNRDLETEIAQRRFREDLYYRINVVTIPVAPLRERGRDVLQLAQTFLEQTAHAQRKAVSGISPEAAVRLLDCDWPGNVRQLRNCMERAVILTAHEKLTVEDLPQLTPRDEPLRAAVGVDADCFLPLLQLERLHVERALKVARGNKARAAQLLALDRRTLYRKLDRYALLDRRSTGAT